MAVTTLMVWGVTVDIQVMRISCRPETGGKTGVAGEDRKLATLFWCGVLTFGAVAPKSAPPPGGGRSS